MENTAPTLRFAIIPYGSALYMQMIRLREKILRIPLGLRFTADELATEEKDFHLAALQAATNSIVACCVLSPLDHQTAKLRQMAVDTAFQRQHVGTALLAFAEQVAWEKGFRIVVLHARMHAVGFYQKQGYRVVSTVFTEVTIPHVQMKKHLSDDQPSLQEPTPNSAG